MWLVSQIMAKGSCLNALKALAEKGIAGFPEPAMAYVLNSTLRGLSYFHSNGHIHRDVKAGNILLGSLGGVRLADFGVSGWLSKGGDKREATKTFVGTPCWMAPEVMEQVSGRSDRQNDGNDIVCIYKLTKTLNSCASPTPL